jgi:hypothetical protein
MIAIFSRLSLPSGGLRAFLYGAAHVFDLGGTLLHERGRFGEGPRGDVVALRHDWDRALRGAWREYGQASER